MWIGGLEQSTCAVTTAVGKKISRSIEYSCCETILGSIHVGVVLVAIGSAYSRSTGSLTWSWGVASQSRVSFLLSVFHCVFKLVIYDPDWIKQEKRARANAEPPARTLTRFIFDRGLLVRVVPDIIADSYHLQLISTFELMRKLLKHHRVSCTACIVCFINHFLVVRKIRKFDLSQIFINNNKLNFT